MTNDQQWLEAVRREFCIEFSWDQEFFEESLENDFMLREKYEGYLARAKKDRTEIASLKDQLKLKDEELTTANEGLTASFQLGIYESRKIYKEENLLLKLELKRERLITDGVAEFEDHDADMLGFPDGEAPTNSSRFIKLAKETQAQRRIEL